MNAPTQGMNREEYNMQDNLEIERLWNWPSLRVSEEKENQSSTKSDPEQFQNGRENERTHWVELDERDGNACKPPRSLKTKHRADRKTVDHGKAFNKY